MPLLAVGPSASVAYFQCPECTVQHSSSFLGRADTPAWPWLFAGGRCRWLVAFHHSVWEGLVVAKPASRRVVGIGRTLLRVLVLLGAIIGWSAAGSQEQDGLVHSSN
jgi:hypothetical protein